MHYLKAPRAVSVTLRAVVNENDVRLIHECPGAPADEETGLFGIPRQPLKPGEAERLVANLAPWQIE
jgi:hypothetical protein